MDETQRMAIASTLKRHAAELLQPFDIRTLVAAARGEIDLNAMALKELANRGMGRDGDWIGFQRAAETMRDAPEDRIIEEIAIKAFGIETLTERKSDRLDFFETSVWTARKALKRAFLAGKAAANITKEQ